MFGEALNMKWQALGLLAILFVSGCGESGETSDRPALAVTFFGANLCTQSPLDTHAIPLNSIPPVSEAPGEFGMSPSVTNGGRHWIGIAGVASSEKWYSPEHVRYTIFRDSKGNLSVQASLVAAKYSDKNYNIEDIDSPPLPLVPREGESGVFLLPDETHPKYAVCFVVTSAPPSDPAKGEGEDAESGSGNLGPSGDSQSGSSGANSRNTTPDPD